MFIVNVLINLILDNNLILSVAEMQKNALIVSAFGFADKVLAVLDSAEKDLHPLVDMEESLDESELTMNAAAADWESR